VVWEVLRNTARNFGPHCVEIGDACAQRRGGGALHALARVVIGSVIAQVRPGLNRSDAGTDAGVVAHRNGEANLDFAHGNYHNVATWRIW
jgi:hypothetical protein